MGRTTATFTLLLIRLTERRTRKPKLLLLGHLSRGRRSRSFGFLLLRSVSRFSRRAKVAVVSPTHPTQAFRTSLRLKRQDRVLRITVRFQRSRATSANRRVTMPTIVSTRGVFLLLLLSDRQVQLWSSITPSTPRSIW